MRAEPARPAGPPAPATADDGRQAIRECLQRRFALAGDSAASARLLEVLFAYRLARRQGREGGP